MHLAARIAAHDMDCDAHKGVMSIMHNYWADACWPFIAGRVSCMLYRIGQVELHAILRLRNFLLCCPLALARKLTSRCLLNKIFSPQSGIGELR